jgi:hypothetical protein
VKSLPAKASILVDGVVAVSIALFARALLTWSGAHDYWRFAAYLAVTVFAARFRVSLPRITGSMAVNLPFILIAVLELSLREALIIAAVSTFAQCFWPASKRSWQKIAFNVGVLVISAQLAWMASRFLFHDPALQVAAGAVAILLANTLPVAAVIGFTEEKRVWATWMQIVQLTFPYFLVTAGLAALVKLADHAVGWQIPLAVLPATLLMYRSFVMYFREMSATAPKQQTMGAAAGH